MIVKCTFSRTWILDETPKSKRVYAKTLNHWEEHQHEPQSELTVAKIKKEQAWRDQILNLHPLNHDMAIG